MTHDTPRPPAVDLDALESGMLTRIYLLNAFHVLIADLKATREERDRAIEKTGRLLAEMENLR